MYLGNTPLTYVHSVKYLGYHLRHDMSDIDDMLAKLRVFYASSNKLIRLFSACSDDVKVYLFNSFCSQFYLCHLWANFPLRVLSRLRVAYNNAVRKLFHLPYMCSVSQTFPGLKVLTFEALLRFSRGSFRTRLFRSSNTLLSEVLHSDIFWCSRIHTLYRRTLFAFS